MILHVLIRNVNFTKAKKLLPNDKITASSKKKKKLFLKHYIKSHREKE